MSEPLKKCPFCGGEAHVSEETRQDGGVIMSGHIVWCGSCNSTTDLYYEQHQAIAAWNRRNPDVVYCRECEHYGISPYGGRGCCVHSNGRTGIMPRNQEDYCSYGKRRDD